MKEAALEKVLLAHRDDYNFDSSNPDLGKIEFSLDDAIKLRDPILKRRLTDLGFAFGHGDAFLYRGQGVVLVGDSTSGKTTLMEKFIMHDGAEALVRDDLTLIDEEDSGCFKIIREACFKGLSAEEIIKKYIAYLANAQTFPLDYIVHLETDGEPCEGLTAVHVPSALAHIYSLDQDRRSLWRRMSGIRFLEYSTVADSNILRDFERMYDVIKNALQ